MHKARISAGPFDSNYTTVRFGSETVPTADNHSYAKPRYGTTPWQPLIAAGSKFDLNLGHKDGFIALVRHWLSHEHSCFKPRTLLGRKLAVLRCGASHHPSGRLSELKSAFSTDRRLPQLLPLPLDSGTYFSVILTFQALVPSPP